MLRPVQPSGRSHYLHYLLFSLPTTAQRGQTKHCLKTFMYLLAFINGVYGCSKPTLNEPCFIIFNLNCKTKTEGLDPH